MLRSYVRYMLQQIGADCWNMRCYLQNKKPASGRKSTGWCKRHQQRYAAV